MNKKSTKTSSVQELQNSIESLEERIEHENKFSRVFILGLVSGFGRTLGATVIFALLVILVSSILYWLGWFPDFNDYLIRFIPGELE